MARERQGVGVGLRGLEACGQSVDMAGKGGYILIYTIIKKIYF